MNVKIAPTWKSRLSDEFEKPYFTELSKFVRSEYASNTVYPPGSEIFKAFDACSFDTVKVVILGQDQYPGQGQENGFSTAARADDHRHITGTQLPAQSVEHKTAAEPDRHVA